MHVPGITMLVQGSFLVIKAQTGSLAPPPPQFIAKLSSQKKVFKKLFLTKQTCHRPLHLIPLEQCKENLEHSCLHGMRSREMGDK